MDSGPWSWFLSSCLTCVTWKREAGREKEQCKEGWSGGVIVSRSSWTVSAPPRISFTEQLRRNPHLPTDSAELRRDDESMKHLTFSSSNQLALSLSLSLIYSVVRTVKCLLSERRGLLSQSRNSSPQVLRQRFHGDASTLRTLADAVALPELTFLLSRKNVLQSDVLKHTWAGATENTPCPSVFPFFP